MAHVPAKRQPPETVIKPLFSGDVATPDDATGRVAARRHDTSPQSITSTQET
jgi:hypothetical protein